MKNELEEQMQRSKVLLDKMKKDQLNYEMSAGAERDKYESYWSDTLRRHQDWSISLMHNQERITNRYQNVNKLRSELAESSGLRKELSHQLHSELPRPELRLIEPSRLRKDLSEQLKSQLQMDEDYEGKFKH